MFLWEYQEYNKPLVKMSQKKIYIIKNLKSEIKMRTLLLILQRLKGLQVHTMNNYMTTNKTTGWHKHIIRNIHNNKLAKVYHELIEYLSRLMIIKKV